MHRMALNRVETMMILMIVSAEIAMVNSGRFCIPRFFGFKSGSRQKETYNTPRYSQPQPPVYRYPQPTESVVFQIPNQRQPDVRGLLPSTAPTTLEIPNQRIIEKPDSLTELAKDGNVAVCAYRSRLTYMEDRYDMKRNVGKNDVSLFALYDGHGGAFVSEYASKNLLRIISKKISENKSEDINYEDILKTQIMEFDEKLRTQNESKAFSVGSTALIGLIDPKKKILYVANLGDTHGEMCCTHDGQAIPLSEDHDPRQRIDEVERINKVPGGFIDDKGYVNGKLNLTRSLGDFELKNDEYTVISSEPEIKNFCLSINPEMKPEFVIFATDGGWTRNADSTESINAEEAIDVIKRYYKEKFFGVHELARYVDSNRVGRIDNTTVMVVKLEDIVGKVGGA